MIVLLVLGTLLLAEGVIALGFARRIGAFINRALPPFRGQMPAVMRSRVVGVASILLGVVAVVGALVGPR